MSYRLALLSAIPLVPQGAGFASLDLWVRDLQAQVGCTPQVTLFSPVQPQPPADWPGMQALPDGIRVVDTQRLSDADLQQALRACDVVQLPGNFTLRKSAQARRFARAARRLGLPVIVGISSDRARTLVMNAAGASLLHRLRARLLAASVRLSQRALTARADGTFIVGEGLRRLVSPRCAHLFVNTASWISSGDILPLRAPLAADAPLRLCAAARLEPMKGIHLAIEAFALLAGALPRRSMRLDVAGEGAQADELRALSVRRGVDDRTRLVGALKYPGPFLEFLDGQDVVVLTNLNDEQPRIVFDAICRGSLLVCPDSPVYRALGLPPAVLYERGNAQALAERLRALACAEDTAALRQSLRALVDEATIEGMHRRRRDWIVADVLRTTYS